MKLIDPDDRKAFHHFKFEWESCYTALNPVKMPSLTSLRAFFQYGSFGSIPGQFISAIIQNNMYEAYSCVQPDEVDRIHGTLQYMLIRLPFEAYGSPEKMQRWIEKMKKSKMFRPTTLY